MFAKVLKQDLYCEAAFYIWNGAWWQPHNKYGEKLDTARSIYSDISSDTLVRWVADNDVTVEIGKPKFERKIEFPLVIKSTVYIWIMENEKDGLCLLTNGQKKEKSYCKASNLIGDCKRNPSEFKELKGNERDLVLMMYKYVK